MIAMEYLIIIMDNTFYMFNEHVEGCNDVNKMHVWYFFGALFVQLGVHQDSVLSPLLFNIFITFLSHRKSSPESSAKRTTCWQSWSGKRGSYKMPGSIWQTGRLSLCYSEYTKTTYSAHSASILSLTFSHQMFLYHLAHSSPVTLVWNAKE